MKYEAGQDVVVTFDGEECQGEVVSHHNGWVTAKVLIDLTTDWGRVATQLAPISYVAVRERDVRPA